MLFFVKELKKKVFMFDKEFVHDIIEMVEEVLETIQKRSASITCANDFLSSESGMILLDSICMKLVAVGESIKNLDKITNKQLFSGYKEINWKDIMGMRDIIVHHYFDIDAGEIFKTLKEDIPLLQITLHKIRKSLK